MTIVKSIVENEIIAEAQRGNEGALDIVRRRKIERVKALTGRALVIYAVDIEPLNSLKAQFTGGGTSITLSDKDLFDEITRNLVGTSTQLDVLIHSPGGSAEATEAIVDLLRSRFETVRFIVPSIAKSAATMLAMSGDEILMDEVGELGPTDPQFLMPRERGLIAVPAQAIKDQFDTAQKEIATDPSKLAAWMPILRELGPGMLAVCDNQIALAENLVAQWLEQYMFRGDGDAQVKAHNIAHFLSQHNNFGSHARRIGLVKLQELGVRVLDLRTQPGLHTAIRELYASIIHTFEKTGVYKMFENNLSEAWFTSINIEVRQEGPEPPQNAPRIALPEPNKSREQRRQEEQARRRRNK